ncbi:hypothetical protein KC318_g24 [Hortaea werneckii]|nr:hypothetical protein KC355_g25 [Hortaea werneckii]KAI7676760.1 hypothetical protein KC318_g24 [Hortaea werneckii]
MELHAEMAEFAHRVIFALLYGYDVQAEVLTARWEDPDRCLPYCVSPLRDTEITMQILSYAEYYGCFDRIVPLFREVMLEKSEHLWMDVAQNSDFYVQFAVKLQNTKLYCDALRHLIVQKRSDGRTEDWATCNYTERPFDPDRAPWTILNMTQEAYTAKFQPAIKKLDAVLGRLERNLHQLQLQPYHYRFSCERSTARTTFLSFLSRQAKRHKHRTANAHLWERSEFLARSLWGQWLVQQLHGDYVYTGAASGKDRSNRAGPFNVVCRKIVEASESKDPTWTRSEIVQEAAVIVEKAFEVEEWSARDSGVEHRYTTRWCEYDEYEGFFMYLPLDETDVPWKGNDACVVLRVHNGRRGADRVRDSRMCVQVST